MGNKKPATAGLNAFMKLRLKHPVELGFNASCVFSPPGLSVHKEVPNNSFGTVLVIVIIHGG